MESVTVLLSVYNGLPFLADTLESLKRQHHRAFRACVVDNASDDGSAELLARMGDERFRVVRARDNLGIPQNFNRAFDLVETPYFALVHQDDVYEPEFLGAMLELIERYPAAFIAHSKVEPIDEAGAPFFVRAERYKERFWPREDPYERGPADGVQALGEGNYVVMPTVMYRTAAVRRIGPFAKEYRFLSDWQYWIRGLLAGFSIAGTHRKLVRRRWHRGMGTRTAEADGSRYGEEVAITEWIARAAHEAGFRPTPTADYSRVMNLVLDDFARRLAGGHEADARRLLALAGERVPGFKGSSRELAARTAARLGRFGGSCLELAGAAYVRVSS